MRASEKGLPQSLKVLIESGAAVDVTLPSTGDSALHLSARCPNRSAAISCVRTLVEAGAVPTLCNAAKRTPLDEALECGSREIHDFLKSYVKSTAETVNHHASQELIAGTSPTPKEEKIETKSHEPGSDGQESSGIALVREGNKALGFANGRRNASTAAKTQQAQQQKLQYAILQAQEELKKVTPGGDLARRKRR